jgi:hypothetical protein
LLSLDILQGCPMSVVYGGTPGCGKKYGLREGSSTQ